MRIKAKEAKQRIKLLTDPQPSFMALVDHGACQTPFQSVKSVRGKPVSQETNTMAVKGKGSKAPEPKLTKMQLSKAKFQTRKAVTAYLKENNIEGTGAIEDGDDVWVVKSAEDFSNLTLGKPRATATKHEGVTAFIAPVVKAAPPEEDDDEDEDEADETTAKDLRDGDDDDEDGEDGEDGEEEEEEEASDTDPKKPSKKAASKAKVLDGTDTKVRRAPAPKGGDDDEDEDGEEITPVLDLAKKYDWWGAYTSGSDTLLGVLKDGMAYDNVPPGMEDVMMAAFTTIGNVLSDDSASSDKLTTLKQMGDELATLTVGLYDLFSQATEDASKSLKPSVRKSAKAFAESFAESVSRMVDGDVSAIDNVSNDEDDKPAKGKKASVDGDAIADAVAKALAPALKAVEKVAKRQDSIDETLARSQVTRSMSDSLTELVDEEDLEGEEDEAEDEGKARLEEVRRSMGLSVASA